MKIIKKHFWIILLIFLFSALFQYAVQLGIPGTIPPNDHFGLTRNTFDRILLLIPVIYAGWVYGLAGGLIMAGLSIGVSLPQALIFSNAPLDSILEVTGMAATGVIISFLFWSQTKERKKADKALVDLEFARHTLQNNLDALTFSQKRLETLNSENTRLYNEQSEITARLAISESKYRRLFEHASDAIWANDLNGKIILANRASAELMGDSIEQMAGSDVRKFLPPEGLVTARSIREALLAGKPIQQPYEQRLVRKDKSEIILMVSSSLVKSGDEPVVFEHVARDVTKERRMQDNLRYYVQQITRTQEEERNRIARDLHDDTAQALYALTRSVDNYTRSSVNLPAETIVFLKSLDEQLRSVLQSVRRFSQELRPPMLDDLGLMSTLRWLVSDMERRLDISASLDVSGTPRRLAQHIELEVFRIIQESLRNVEKHAGATRIDVMVQFGTDTLNIIIRDNGKGFTLSGELGELPREGRLGLVGMAERAKLIGGSIKIESEINIGTKIVVELPV